VDTETDRGLTLSVSYLLQRSASVGDGEHGGGGVESKEDEEEEEDERDFNVYTEARPPRQLLPSTVLPNNKPVIGTFSS